MHPLDIRAELVRNDITIAAVARSLGVSRQLVSLVVHQRHVNHRVRRAVAAAISSTYLDVWGEPDPSNTSEATRPETSTTGEE